VLYNRVQDNGIAVRIHAEVGADQATRGLKNQHSEMTENIAASASNCNRPFLKHSPCPFT
jgi:hypothetical protein